MKRRIRWMTVVLAVCVAVSLLPTVSFASEEVAAEQIPEAVQLEAAQVPEEDPVPEEAAFESAQVPEETATEIGEEAVSVTASEETASEMKEEAGTETVKEEAAPETPEIKEEKKEEASKEPVLKEEASETEVSETGALESSAPVQEEVNPPAEEAYNFLEPSVELIFASEAVTAPLTFVRAEASFDNSTNLKDGTYQVSSENFSFTGGTGKARLWVEEVVVSGGKATAVFHASSKSMTHVYIGTAGSSNDDPSIYDPSTGNMTVNTHPIVSQQVTLPVRVNEEIAIAARSTAMSEPHWIQYQYKITIEVTPEEDPGKEDPGKDDPGKEDPGKEDPGKDDSDKEDLSKKSADYSAVEKALSKVPADLSIYTSESVKVLQNAIKAVKKGKKASEQKTVDSWAAAIEEAIKGLEIRIEDGRINLSITNNTGMFKAVTAYLITKAGKTELVMALSGTGYHELIKGTYEQAAANGNNRSGWIHGALNKDGKWEFRIPVASGETFIPIVAVSQTYLEGFEAGENSLERSFFPRQILLNIKAKTIVTGDYEFSKTLKVINNVTMFKPETAVLETVGGPNSNSYRSDMVMTLGSDAFDKAFLGTKEAAEKAETTYAIEDRAFTIPVRWVRTFGQPETMETVIGKPFILSFHSVRRDEWYERVFTIDETKGTVTIDPVDEAAPVDPTPVNPTPVNPSKPGENPSSEDQEPGYQDSVGGSTAAVDNSTGLADGVYTPEKFAFSGGSGRIVITCNQVEVRDGKAYATIAFTNLKSGSTEMSYVKASGGTYYCTNVGGKSIATIPVELNQNNSILALTTKMSAAHEIAYTIFVYISGADKKGGAQPTAQLTANETLDTEAPDIAGLEYQDEEKLEEAEYFKIFNYSDGIRLLEIDMRLDEKEENKEDPEDTKESEKEDSEEALTFIDEETGMEVSVMASKQDAQAKLYKGNIVKYLIVPEDVEIPAGLDKETVVIELPVEGVYSGSEEIAKTMEELKVSELIKAQEKEDKDKKIAGAGAYNKLKLKTLVKNKCGVAMLPGEILKDKKERETFYQLSDDLAHIDIISIVDRSEMEKSDKAKAEWLKVYGILFGCEEAAETAYNAVK